MKRFTLAKQERLYSRKDIEVLFREGHSLTKYPIRLVWRETTSSSSSATTIQAMFSVSKKKFSKAVDRNRVKRLMKEAYRLIRPEVIPSLPDQKYYHFGWIYTGTELPEFETIQKSITAALDRWIKNVNGDR